MKLNKGSERGGVEGDGEEQSLPVIFQQLSVTLRGGAGGRGVWSDSAGTQPASGEWQAITGRRQRVPEPAASNVWFPQRLLLMEILLVPEWA